MSQSPSRKHRRRAQRATRRLHPDAQIAGRKTVAGEKDAVAVAVLAAWAEHESVLPEARQRSHDRLIEMMGSKRTGGVAWKQGSDEDAQDILDTLLRDTPTDDPASLRVSEHYLDLKRRIAETPGSWVVVAIAPGIP